MARILLVEDEPQVAEITADLLGGQGHEIRVAPAVEPALAIIAEAWPEMVISDFLLGSSDGRPVAAAAQRSGMRVLMITGALDGKTDELAWPVLRKPFRFAALIDAVDGVLAGAVPPSND